MKLRQHEWALKYTPDHGDLVAQFYVPALRCAVSYDRTTGYFSAPVLTVAMRGIEGLLRNQGRVRLIVGCTLGREEVEAVRRGEELRDVVADQLTGALEVDSTPTHDALELLSWMVHHGILEMKVAVPCDAKRRPITATGIFHEKAGIITDGAGDRVAFNGSINETAAGWIHNWESFNVFTSWKDEARVRTEEDSFARLWANKAQRVITLDVPAAVRNDLLRFLPENDKPARLGDQPDHAEPHSQDAEAVTTPPPAGPEELRRQVWSYIARAATLDPGGERVGEATAAVEPWPHQVLAFDRLYGQVSPRLLIADEVGLGKTIQAGMLLRQLWLAGRAQRMLILAPAAVLRQWQIELHDKFNLNWPIYDGAKLTWHPVAGQPPRVVNVARATWHEQPFVIASSHLMRRVDRRAELLEHASPWDLVIVDEAHHARRRAAGTSSERPNALLTLLRGIRNRTSGLLLLTATPMQVDPIEVWDLLDVLGLPDAWDPTAFLRFFEILENGNPSNEEFETLAGLFRAAEAAYGEADERSVARFGVTGLKARSTLNALRDASSIPRKRLSAEQRRAAVQVMKSWSPVGRMISRNTRALLREYYRQGKITTPIAERIVEDRFIDMSPGERRVYEEVEDYISSTYNAATTKRTAVGFVMTVYRRRMSSSFRALANTLKSRLVPVTAMAAARFTVSEDASDDESREEVMDADEVATLEREARAVEERAGIERLLDMVRPLPRDTKAEALLEILRELRAQGYGRVMVFSQYTDTMDFVRSVVVDEGFDRVVCLSGRGAEALEGHGSWRRISRDELKRRFRDGTAELLLCTDAAAEGLNLQFCGAIVNYDMPWNPMRVEQRIGRIDRLGQEHAKIRVVNLHYSGTVEADVYIALRERIGLFESVVGRLQPILSTLPGRITKIVLQDPRSRREEARGEAVNAIEREAEAAGRSGFDLDEFVAADIELPPRSVPALDLTMLDAVIRRTDLLPPGVEVRPLGQREYGYVLPGLRREVRVTTDATYYEQNPESVELWSPGSEVFPALPEVFMGTEDTIDPTVVKTLLSV